MPRSFRPGSSSAHAQGRRFRPNLEALEDRVAPAFDLVISTDPTNAVSKVTANGLTTFTAIDTGATLNTADIEAELSAGNNVTVSTGTGGNEPGNILVNAAIHGSTAEVRLLDLRTDASSTAGDILIAAPIALGGQLGFAAAAVRHLSVSAGISLAPMIRIGIGNNTVTLEADADANGVGTLTLGPGVQVGPIRQVVLRAAEISIDTSANPATVVAGQTYEELPAMPVIFQPDQPPRALRGAISIQIRSSVAARPMSIGGADDAVDGINLTDAELARLRPSALSGIDFGDDSQTGDITFVTATPSARLRLDAVYIGGRWFGAEQALKGGGKIVLDDEGEAAALDGRGSALWLRAGMGGIVAANPSANDIAEIATRGPSVLLATRGPIGNSAAPIEIYGEVLFTVFEPLAPDLVAAVGSSPIPVVHINSDGVHNIAYPDGPPVFMNDAYLRGLGSLGLGNLSTFKNAFVDVANDVYLLGMLDAPRGAASDLFVHIGLDTPPDAPAIATVGNGFGGVGVAVHLFGRAGGIDVLQGRDRDSSFYIYGGGFGYLDNIVFSDFESLHGGAGNDIFLLSEAGPSDLSPTASSIGRIDGGRGQDALYFGPAVDPSVAAFGPGSTDGYQGSAATVRAFDNLEVGRRLVFAIAADGTVKVRRVDLAGKPLGAWLPTAPGAFIKIAAAPLQSRNTMAVGVSVDGRIRYAIFGPDGALQTGWVATGLGRFTDVAVTTAGEPTFPRPFAFAFGLNADGQIYGGALAWSGFSPTWTLLAPGYFSSVVAARPGIVFGVGLDHHVYAARVADAALAYGFYPVAPGEFAKLSVSERSDGSVELFGLGLNQNVYAAEFKSDGTFDYGWFLTAPGVFTDIAAAPLGAGALGAWLLATGQNLSLGRTVVVSHFDASGNLGGGWLAANKALFSQLGASLGNRSILFGIPNAGTKQISDGVNFDLFAANAFQGIALSI